MVKLEIIVIIQENIEVLRIAYVPKKISMVFHNESNYDYLRLFYHKKVSRRI